jgi:hypothetical protein
VVAILVLILGVVCGALTVGFILHGVWRMYRSAVRTGVRVLLITTLLSILTGVLTIWQLIDALGQFGFH